MEDAMAKNPRKLRNFMLQPSLQVRMGFYNIIATAIFVAVLLLVIRMNFGAVYDTVLELTDVKEEVIDVLLEHATDTMRWIVGLSIAFLAINITVAIWYTHRFVGPAVAFKRHLDALIAENYDIKTTIRENDAFQEIADKLNELSAILKKRSSK